MYIDLHVHLITPRRDIFMFSRLNRNEATDFLVQYRGTEPSCLNVNRAAWKTRTYIADIQARSGERGLAGMD